MLRFEEYDKRYKRALYGVHRARVSAAFSAATLHDYPQNIPSTHLRNFFRMSFGLLVPAVARLSEMIGRDGSDAPDRELVPKQADASTSAAIVGADVARSALEQATGWLAILWKALESTDLALDEVYGPLQARAQAAIPHARESDAIVNHDYEHNAPESDRDLRDSHSLDATEDRVVGPLMEMMTLLMLELELNGRLWTDFSVFLAEQQLVMTVAFVEVFVADSCRAVHQQAGLRNGSDDIAVKKAVSQGPFDERWRNVEYHLDVQAGLKDEHIDVLADAFLLRNQVLHHGGRVTSNLAKRLRRIPAQAGAHVPVSAAYSVAVDEAATEALGALYESVARKHFGVKAHRVVHAGQAI